MRISLTDAMARLPLPATERWPEGVWDTEAFTHGSMSVVLFVPANKAHRFEEFSQDLITWAVFWGPQGGEAEHP